MHRGRALLDVLAAGRDEQHVEHVGIALGAALHFEVVADFFHREGDVLVRLQLDLAFELALVQRRGHLDDLRDRGVAADRDGGVLGARAGALVCAAHGFADGLDVDDRLLVDGVHGRRLGRVGLEAVAITAHAELDELDRRGRDVEAEHGSLLVAEYHLIFLPRLGVAA